MKILEGKVRNPNFWEEEENPALIQQRINKLKNELEPAEELGKEINDLETLIPLMKGTLTEENEMKEKIESLEKKLKELRERAFLSDKYDSYAAILTIQAGTGGRDAEDWAALLLRMYQHFCDDKGWDYRILSENFSEGGGPEGRVGIREVSMEIKGKYAYGLLKGEGGVHRLVRLSPFSAKSLRHTSFAKVEVLPDIKDEELEIKIDPDDLRIETFRASGPGGQYVNRRESAVRITHLPTGISVACQTERLQGENRKRAMQILKTKLYNLEKRKKEAEMEEIREKEISPDFGSQIRSYIFHPYKLVKDHRTKVETDEVEEVLDGKLDAFIEKEMEMGY